MLDIVEYNNNTLKTPDCESRAIIVSDFKSNYKSLIEFGKHCINLNSDEYGEFYISRFEKPEYKVVLVSENSFWRSFNIIRNYIDSHILCGINDKIIEAYCFWDDWNNIFQVFEVNDFYYGINWWTTV